MHAGRLEGQCAATALTQMLQLSTVPASSPVCLSSGCPCTQAAQPASAGPSGMPAEMDVASIIATFPPELREEALMGFIGNEEVGVWLRAVCFALCVL